MGSQSPRWAASHMPCTFRQQRVAGVKLADTHCESTSSIIDWSPQNHSRGASAVLSCFSTSGQQGHAAAATTSLGDGQAWRFDGDWSPQNNYRNGCPIVFATGSGRTASLAHTVTLRPAGGNREIALLRVYSTEPSPTRPTLLYSKGRSFDMGQLRFHCVQLAARLDVNVLYYDYSGYGFNRLGVEAERFSHARRRARRRRVSRARVGRASVADDSLRLFAGERAYCLPRRRTAPRKRASGVVLRSAFISGVAAATDVIQKHAISYAPVGGLRRSWTSGRSNALRALRCADPGRPRRARRATLALACGPASESASRGFPRRTVPPRRHGHLDVERRRTMNGASGPSSTTRPRVISCSVCKT